MTQPRVVAVLVSFNRQALLRQAIAALSSADQLPAALVVVDNGSTDGSVEYLRGLKLPFDYELIELKQNTGGAGGFTVGMAHALAAHRPDLLWVMDDDTEPHPQTLAEAVKLWTQYPASQALAFIASKVLWSDGREHPMNSPRTRFAASAAAKRQAAAQAARPVRSASFVSLFVSAEAIRSDGLPVADYFLWNDDFEFTARLARDRVGLASLASSVTHHTKVFDSNTVDIGERFYFEVRNKLWMFIRSTALGPMEKLLYGAATLRRWASMVSRSSSRSVVLRAGLRGLRDGVLRKPRANQQVLQGIHRLPEWKLDAEDAGSSRAAVAQSPFSVLLPVYAADDPAKFKRALDSVTVQQSRPPTEVVVVRDGPVAPQIEALLKQAEESSSWLKVLRRERACGLAQALDAGLAACSHELVARMDADDISVPQRFERQLPYLEAGYDIVGSAIEEIGEDETQLLAYRPVPWDERDIKRSSSFRSPFHHPSVSYRKSAVQRAGGYGRIAGVEDYWLWLRMLHQGAKAANLPEALLYYRVSAGAYHRRGGWKMFAAELNLQNRMRSAGYIGPAGWLRNVLIRGGYRLIPTAIRKAGYRGAFTESPAENVSSADSPER